MNKYYWFSAEVTYKETGIQNKESNVLDQHPFEWEAYVAYGGLPDAGIYDYTLLSWKEITKEEYDLYKKLNNDETP